MDSDQLKDRLLFAIPKKGRLAERCLRLLDGADIQFSRAHRLDIALSTNLPLALVFLPANDIAMFVGQGNVDIGLTGKDMVVENGTVADELLELGFGKCSLSVQVPEDGSIQSIDDLIGKRVATSFENVVKRYFTARENGFNHEETATLLIEDIFHPVFSKASKTIVTYIGGSVETACALGVADAIVDLVESGETMRAAKLKSIGTILKSQAVLISNPRKHDNDQLVQKICRRLRGVIDAERYVLCTYNIRRASMADAFKITPGKKAPSVSPLEDTEWIAISVMVLKSNVVDCMDELTSIGAEDILILDIHNCRVADQSVCTLSKEESGVY
ncbi:ATP phosphoribosyltransferase (ATP-PRTase) (ATP-PRT) [Batrachochytrium dendrobatidis]